MRNIITSDSDNGLSSWLGHFKNMRKYFCCMTCYLKRHTIVENIPAADDI